MFTIFANMKMDNADRLQHFKDSFDSISDISDDWLINIRGLYRNQALDYIREKLKGRMIEFSLLDDKRRWSRNALEMTAKAKYNYILMWNEDHINLVPQDIYKELVKELAENKVDNMTYSWWFFGRQNRCFNGYKKKELKYVDIVELTPEVWEKIKARGYVYGFISVIDIFHKDLLHKVLKEDIKKWSNFSSKFVYKMIHLPSWFGFKINEMDYYHFFQRINHKFFRDKFPFYTLEGPFNVEKENFRTDYLPLTFAIPRQELFACINKDMNMGEGRYTLLDRGLYYY